MNKSGIGSWKTSAAGLLAAISILSSQGSAVLDDDPATNAEISEIFAACCLIGLGMAARDNKVTSEQAGAVQPHETSNPKSEISERQNA